MKIIIILLLTVFMYGQNVFGLSVETHEDLNEGIIKPNTKYNFDEYLKNNLNLNSNRLQVVNGKEIFRWFRDGGLYEDKPPITIPYARSTNHFHDPLVPIGEAGYGLGNSAIVWAQKPSGTQWPGENYSWHDVRSTFYTALVGFDNTSRDQNLAETFRGLGQLMHLVQDMSVPEHARDDGHVAEAYEEWVAFANSRTIQNECTNNLQALNNALTSPKFFDFAEMLTASVFPEAPVSIANLFDRNIYTGSNPADTLQENPLQTIGLAEYTNANFVSKDTIFTPYSYPALSSVAMTARDYPDPFQPGHYVQRLYYMKTGDGDAGYRLAGVNYLKLYNPQTEESVTIPPMDDCVFQDYAYQLLPRAVGYSATLLQYFFRGDLTTSGYALENSIGDISGLHLKIVNNTEYEALSNGNFIVSYRYRPASTEDFVYGVSYAVSSGQLNPPPNNCGRIYTFTFSPSIPATAVDIQYTLVFRGTLGNETGDAVIAKVIELGPTGFVEEWNNDLHGNHSWIHSDLDFPEYNPPNGITVNQVDSGKFVKENVRQAGYKSARWTESLIGDAFSDGSGQYCLEGNCVANDFGLEFPLEITPCTTLDIKIDELATTPQIPFQNCAGAYGKGSFQGLILKFDNGIRLTLTTPEEDPPFGGYVANITAGIPTTFNIFAAFENAGPPSPQARNSSLSICINN